MSHSESELNFLCDKFEDAWRAGKAPSIRRLLEGLPPELQSQALEDLLRIDIEFRKVDEFVSPDFYADCGDRAVALAESILFEQQSAPTGEFIEGEEPLSLERTRDSNSVIAKSDQIGPYKLLQKIGEGGMGVVWMAEQTHPVRRRVALKLIKVGSATKEVIARFEAERQALAMMDHQNIAKVLDAGTTESGSPFFVMELVKGIPITKFCDDNRLGIEERLKLFVPVCKAVQHAHVKGIIHRDLKPSNVLVTLYDGEAVPKVIDFGLAKATEHTLKLTEKTMFTEFGKIVGTLQYMSPEQAELNALDVDTRTDVYSLGVMLYELLTGSTPLAKEELGENAFLQLLEMIREKEPQRPSNRFSTLGESSVGISRQRRIAPARLEQILRGELDWVVMKALEKDRRRRYETAKDFADDIQNYLDDETVLARPPSGMYRARKFFRKNRGLVFTLALIFGLLCAGIAGTSFGLLKANEKTAEAVAERETAKRNEQLAITAEEVAKREATRADAEAKRARDSEAAATFQLANSRWENNRARDARKLLNEIPEVYRKHFEWNFCNRLFWGSDLTLFADNDAFRHVTFSPDGRKVSGGGWSGQVYTWETTNGNLVDIDRREQFKGGVVGFGTELESGQKWVATRATDFGLSVWKLESEEKPIGLIGHKSAPSHGMFDANCERLASVGNSGIVKVWNVGTGEETASFDFEKKAVSLEFSREGNKLAVGGFDKIAVWDLTHQKQEFVMDFPGMGLVMEVRFSPDQKSLAAACYDRTIKLISLDGSSPVKVFTGHTRWGRSVDFSPDGRMLASGGWDHLIKLWDIQTGKEIRTLKGHDSSIERVRFSPDGRRLASASYDGTVKLWDVAMTAGAKEFYHEELVNSVALSRDEKSLITGGFRGSIKVWERLSHNLEFELRGHGQAVNCMKLSPDGLKLLSGGQEGKIVIWNLRDRAKVREIVPGFGPISGIDFSPDGTRFCAVSLDGHMLIGSIDDGQFKAVFCNSDKEVNDIAWSPGGDILVTVGDDKLIRAWSTQGDLLQTLTGHTSNVLSVTFTPNGESFATGSLDYSIRLWDSNTFECQKSMRGHDHGVAALAFNESGDRIVSRAWDNAIKIWNSETGEELLTLWKPGGRIRAASRLVDGLYFSPNEDFVIAAMYDSVVEFGYPKMFESERKEIFDEVKIGRELAFHSGDKEVVAKIRNELWTWDLSTGRKRRLSSEEDIDWTRTTSGDGEWRVTSSRANLVLENQNFKTDPQVLNFRARKSAIDSAWHRRQTASAALEKDLYALLFHRSCIMKAEPQFEINYLALQSAYRELKGSLDESEFSMLEAGFSPLVREALSMPKGKRKAPVFLSELKQLNGEYWELATVDGGKGLKNVEEYEIARFRYVVEVIDWAEAHNTLGVVEYRLGNFRNAIASAMESLNHSANVDQENGPYPGDYAILSMSHHELGEYGKAEQFRQAFHESMNKKAYSDDEVCKLFRDEMEVLLRDKESE